jgi:hypothetical protein
MIVWVVDFLGFLLLCVGSNLAMPRFLKLLCRLAVVYLLVFSVCYYLWLIPQYRYFESHLHYIHPGMSMAFSFEGFWQLLGNMILVEGMLPVAVVLIFYFGIKWVAMSTSPSFGADR